MSDPFRPRPRAARFPHERLLRAGLPEQTVEQLADQFTGLGADDRAQLARWVDGHSDSAIRDRYGDAVDPGATPTREQLAEMHVPQLRDRLAARHLPVSGAKPELVDRLLAAYEQPTPEGDAVPDQQQALTGDAGQPQQPAADAPTEVAPPAQPEPPAPAPVEQPAPAPTPEVGSAAAVERPPATLPVGSPGAPAAAPTPAEQPAPEAQPTPTPAADPAGGTTDTGGTA